MLLRNLKVIWRKEENKLKKMNKNERKNCIKIFKKDKMLEDR